MLEVILVGGEMCHRYQCMREMVLGESVRLGVPIHLVEENEVQGILKYNTLNLPLLFICGVKIAQVNPPSRRQLQSVLRRSLTGRQTP